MHSPQRTCRFNSAWVLMVVMAIGASAQDRSHDNRAPSGAGQPQLVCERSEFDFGERDNTEEVTHEFVIRNAGTAPLVIHRVTTSCGCTVAKVSTDPIPPGQETLLRVTFSLKGRRGPQVQTVHVESNDPRNPVYRLSLKGSAVAEVVTEPPFVNFGDLPRDSAVTQTVRIVSRRAGVRIVRVASDSPQFAAQPWPEGDERGIGLDIRTVPPLPSAHLHGKVTVELDHPTVPETSLYVFGVVKGALMVLPREIVLPRTSSGPVARVVLVRPGTVRSYRVLKVESEVPGLEIVTADQGQGTWRIEVRNLRPEDAVHGKVLRIETDVETMKTIEVPIRVVP